jgi:hypothetical protein
MPRAGCTIVSLNYLPYARVLCRSFLRHHPDCSFYVLLVDRLPVDCHLDEDFELIPVESLNIPSFASVAFKYDILELNTNVKPTFLKALLARGIDQLVYLDPDICVYSEMRSVFDALQSNAIALTPHSLSPDPQDVSSEAVLLLGGSFNLGFIGVRKCSETERFLEWWENRCLNLAFNEPKTGLFVDQKWINLAPCFFEGIKVLREPGCNMAFWNLHERELSSKNGRLCVNDSRPLEFFHFSGIAIHGNDQLSRRKSRFTLSNRPDLREIFAEYRSRLVEEGFEEFKKHDYAFGRFDDGQYINGLTRSIYAVNLDKFESDDPFSSSSRFYQWAKSSKLFSARESAKAYNSETYRGKDLRVRVLNLAFRMAIRVLGADRYTVLLKYLSWVAILRNQRDIFRA